MCSIVAAARSRCRRRRRRRRRLTSARFTPIAAKINARRFAVKNLLLSVSSSFRLCAFIFVSRCARFLFSLTLIIGWSVGRLAAIAIDDVRCRTLSIWAFCSSGPDFRHAESSKLYSQAQRANLRLDWTLAVKIFDYNHAAFAPIFSPRTPTHNRHCVFCLISFDATRAASNVTHILAVARARNADCALIDAAIAPLVIAIVAMS